MEFDTELNSTTVTVEYEVDFDEVDCFNRDTGREYSDVVMMVNIERVMYKGVDILGVISPADMTELEMACTANYNEVTA